MKTKHDIHQDQLDRIVTRDSDCIYCHKKMIMPFDSKNRNDSATIEHLNHRMDWYSVQDFNSKNLPVDSIIGICCGACNSSRGSLPIIKWFETSYCKARNINKSTVSKVVQEYVDEYEEGLY